MTITNSFEDLMVDVCLDVDALESVQADTDAALRAVGAPAWVNSFIEHRRGSWISVALSMVRPLPTADEIVDYVQARCAVDAAFADRILVEPKPTLERVYQVVFPAETAFAVTEVDGLVRIVVTDLPDTPVGLRTTSPAIELTDVDTDIDVDVDVDIDVDIEVDVDVFTEIDVDVDIDVDIDTDVVTMNPSGETGKSGAWSRYWDGRRDLWKSRDDRLVAAD